MEQTKALNALEPFIALSKSASSPRAAADLVTRATSAPNTFLFAELLQTPQIQALADSPEFTSHLTLLQIFSYGTYETYHATPDLPALSETQTLKLRQLSLLTLASDRSSLSYDALERALGLSSAREVEDLVITAIYAGLLHATLDPARQAVQNWAARCTYTLGDLENQISNIRNTALLREREKRSSDERLQVLMTDLRDTDKKHENSPYGREALARRGINKRTMIDAMNLMGSDSMDVDEPFTGEDKAKRASKRKM
ncbi:COP9 signalosome complex subunit 7a [Cladobotryum mycophilum]|uniref:COP9 signalosome complex subunit 7a n=1 Tax=Cladobotryum mycophilum TaxID=491253 RepID=A0ABR0SM44_9HYPO